MAKFPKIQRMCPLNDSIANNMDGEICRLCDRKVHNLDQMSDSQRVKFVDSCSEEICVSYSLPKSRKFAALAAMSAALITHSAVAEESVPKFNGGIVTEDIILVAGAIKDFQNVDYIDNAEDLEIPELPVTYEDEDSNSN